MPTADLLAQLQDWRAERQLVSLISTYPDFWPQAAALQPDQFSNVEAREGWVKLRAAFENGLTPDPVDYLNLLDFGHPPVPLKQEAAALIRRVSRSDYRTALVRYAEQLVAVAQKDDAEAAQRLIATPPAQTNDDSTLEGAPEIASRLWDEMTGTDDRMLATGFDPLDRAIGGFEAQTSTILMARPGMGKTAALVQAADIASLRGLVVAVFSKEMSADQFMRRLAARRAEVEVNTVKYRKWSDGQAEAYGRELAALMERPNLIVDGSTPQSTADVLERCAHIRRKFGRLDFVLADHLRLFSDKADNEVHRLGAVSWGFKRIAKEMNTRVIVAAQLNRAVENANDKRPDLKDLRDSGEIEENADNVVAMYRERYYNPALKNSFGKPDLTAEFLTRKARDGERNLRSTCDYIEKFMSFNWEVV